MPEPKHRYIEVGECSREAVELALKENDPKRLLNAVIAVSMHHEDWRYAEDLCLQLCSHPHFNVRGNAILGFGHISRVHGKLHQELVQPIIQAALRDENDYVRGQAVSAADDTAHFLGWRYD